jgi:hypothetical protein
VSTFAPRQALSSDDAQDGEPMQIDPVSSFSAFSAPKPSFPNAILTPSLQLNLPSPHDKKEAIKRSAK